MKSAMCGVKFERGGVEVTSVTGRSVTVEAGRLPRALSTRIFNAAWKKEALALTFDEMREVLRASEPVTAVTPAEGCLNLNMAGRVATVYATRAELVAALGAGLPGCDEKTTIEWYFATPAGNVCLHDYWWNGPTEWSVGAARMEAATLFLAWLGAKLGRDVGEPFDFDAKLPTIRALQAVSA